MRRCYTSDDRDQADVIASKGAWSGEECDNGPVELKMRCGVPP